MTQLPMHESLTSPWTVLLVDDEEDVIEVSRMVLEDLVFEDRPLHILTAGSAREARQVFAEHPDIALAFVDVVMETEHAGLELVKYVRETLRNDRTRLILRTGNPGAAPHGDVVRYLEIDDYKEKTELTADRLGTAVVTSLRGYRNLMARIHVQQGLQAIIEADEPVDEDGQVQAQRLVAQCEAMARQVLGGAAGNGVVLRTGRGGMHALGGFGRWASVAPSADEAVDESADAAGSIGGALNGAVDGAVNGAKHVATDGPQAGWPPALQAALDTALAAAPAQGALPASRAAGGLLLGDRPHPQHGLFLWLEGLDDPISGDDIKVLQLFLGQRAGALARAALQREVIAAQTEVLYRLCEAVESRSKETGAHIRRIARYARALAERLGLAPEVQRMIEMAAPMHDIGKVSIPDAILHKPGPLDAAEWARMQTHAELGHRLLSHPEFPVMQAAAEVAHSHHERWDGTGYPSGLAGEAIPVSGRIVALVDVFDALLSRRAYKQPWPLPQVVDELRRLRGTHFDPRMVDVLLADIDHFHGIFLSLPD